MTTYKDANGKERKVKIDLGVIEDVHQATTVDLLELPQLSNITGSVRRFLPICYWIQTPKGEGETQEEFCEAHSNGDAIDACIDATLEALELFSRKPCGS